MIGVVNERVEELHRKELKYSHFCIVVSYRKYCSRPTQMDS